MFTQTKNKGIQVREGRTYLDVPHLDSELTFVYPAKKGTYIELAEQLDEDNLQQLTMSQNASLIYAAWQNPKEKYSKEIIDILRNSWLVCFNGILYDKEDKGAYIEDRPKIRGNRVYMEKSDLLKRLEANDPSVRFVPFGYKIEKQSSKDLEKNPFVIALAGEEGAQKLAEVSANYKFKPYLYSFDNVDRSAIRVASLDSCRCLGNGMLYVGGFDWGDNDDGYAFGVFRETGGARPKNNKT